MFLVCAQLFFRNILFSNLHSWNIKQDKVKEPKADHSMNTKPTFTNGHAPFVNVNRRISIYLLNFVIKVSIDEHTQCL